MSGDMHPDLDELEVADHLRQLKEPKRLYHDKQGRP